MLMLNHRLAFFLLLITFTSVKAQQNAVEPFKNAEDSCVLYSKELKADLPDSEKLNTNNKLINLLKRQLINPESFAYPFDSLKTFGRLYAPDNSFRIFTWNVLLNNGTYKYFGLIQVPKAKSKKLIELTDRSDEITNPENSVLSAGKWYGVLYYKILREKVDNRTYYTLFAVRYHNLVITKKMIDILFFDEFENPVFGAPIIQVGKKFKHRLLFEYSSMAVVNLRYDEKLKMVIFDHVAAAEPKYNGQFEYYGPDLTFDGLTFNKKVWVYTPNLDLRPTTNPPPKRKPLR